MCLVISTHSLNQIKMKASSAYELDMSSIELIDLNETNAKFVDESMNDIFVLMLFNDIINDTISLFDSNSEEYLQCDYTSSQLVVLKSKKNNTL